MEDKWEQFEAKEDSGDKWGQFEDSGEDKGAVGGIEPQNKLGQFFNVPGAAMRSAIQGTGYAQGAMQPSAVPSFQNWLSEKVNTGNETLDSYLKLQSNIVGAGLDYITNPGDILASFVGSKAIQAVSKHVPKIMTGNWTKAQAVNAKKAVETLEDGVSKMYSKAYGAEVNNIVNKQQVSKVILETPKSLRAKFFPQKTLKDYTVKELQQTMSSINREIGHWKADPKFNPAKLQDLKIKVKDLILKSVSPETKANVLKIDPIYEEVTNKGRAIKNMVWNEKTKTYRTKPIAGLFKGGTSAEQDVFRDLAKKSPELAQVVKNMDKYSRRQFLKKVGAKYAPWLIGGGVGGALIGNGRK